MFAKLKMTVLAPMASASVITTTSRERWLTADHPRAVFEGLEEACA